MLPAKARGHGAVVRRRVGPYPPYRRGSKRRLERRHHEPRRRKRPLVLVLALNAIIAGLLVLAGCAAIPAVAAMLALQGRDWMSTHTIDMPRSGPLDGDLPQTASIISRDGTL